MRLIVTGSGDAFNAAGRGHSCYWLDFGDKGALMVDFGATALQALRRLGLDPLRLKTILVTHLHGDHVGGLPFLTIDGVFRRQRREALGLVGPPGLAERYEALLRVSYGSVADREQPFVVTCELIEPGLAMNVGPVRAEAFRADHVDPPDVALGYRITLPGGRIAVFSGDTAMVPELLDAARGADLLVAECSALAPPAGRHCTYEEWRQVLPGLGIRRIVLTHLAEEVRTAALPPIDAPGTEVLLADDGMTLEL
jgi:ribonuclease BN (tRNA processing enzyme)